MLSRNLASLDKLALFTIKASQERSSPSEWFLIEKRKFFVMYLSSIFQSDVIWEMIKEVLTEWDFIFWFGSYYNSSEPMINFLETHFRTDFNFGKKRRNVNKKLQKQIEVSEVEYTKVVEMRWIWFSFIEYLIVF